MSLTDPAQHLHPTIVRYVNVCFQGELGRLAGCIIGAERQSKGKPAGITTHSFVIGVQLFSHIFRIMLIRILRPG